MDHLLGNPLIKSSLLEVLDSGKFGNSLLFAGPSGVGKSLFAEEFAKRLVALNSDEARAFQKVDHGNHPDVYHYRPEGKAGLHSMESLRRLGEEVFLPPNEADYKVFIIYDAERMISYSANALLKTFEEPPSHTVIILLSDNPERLLPTILSRCRKIFFKPLKEEDIVAYLKEHHNCSDDKASLYASLSCGSLGKAVRLATNDGDRKRDMILDILAQGRFRDYTSLRQAVDKIAEVIKASQSATEAKAQAEHILSSFDDLSAQQRHTLRKEVEGMVSVSMTREVETLLDYLISWYRDCHLLAVGGAEEHLFNSDRLSQLKEYSYPLPALEEVQQYLIDAKLAVERSANASHVFEKLFLQLGLL
ncbi:MAG: ATP-binding protein [Chlamydiota bacterium]